VPAVLPMHKGGRRMSTPDAFQIGQPFDPREAQSAGRYPVDWVDSGRSLKDGPRRIYRYLYGIGVKSDRKENPWRGYVFPDIETIAADLGKSASCVRRDLKPLQKEKLVAVERPNKQEGNRYYFLWQPEFEGPWRKSDEREERLVKAASRRRPERRNVSAQERNPERRNMDSSAPKSDHSDRRNVSATYREDSQFYSQGDPLFFFVR
jgi:hypothetical protein